MTTKTLLSTITGELQGNGERHLVGLQILVRELWSDESSHPTDSTIDHIRLSPAGALIPDGNYTLRYQYNGKLFEQNVRILYGELISGS